MKCQSSEIGIQFDIMTLTTCAGFEKLHMLEYKNINE